jgi:hypothetical protein
VISTKVQSGAGRGKVLPQNLPHRSSFRRRSREWYRVHRDTCVLLTVLAFSLAVLGAAVWFAENERCIEGTVDCATPAPVVRQATPQGGT